MSRPHSAANLAEINASHLHEVVLVKLEFSTPVYVHSSIGSITFESNEYLGVGQLGNISQATETESLRPTSITLSLSAVDANLLLEALDAGTYGDKVTIYIGYRQDDGLLAADPWIVWAGKLEYSSVNQGVDNTISIVVRHDLAILDESEGSRFSDEDQQKKFAGDLGFEYVSEMSSLKLLWAGGRVGGLRGENDGGPGADHRGGGRNRK